MNFILAYVILVMLGLMQGFLSKDEMTKLMEKYERSKNKNKRDHSIHEHTTLCE